MRMALAALCLLSASPQEAPVSRLIDQLGDEDPDLRDRATAELLRRGEAARPALEKALSSPDVEVAGRAAWLLVRIAPCRVSLDKKAFATSEAVPARLRILNTDGRERLYYGRGFDVRVDLLEVHEAPPQEGRRYCGRGWGRSSTGCALSGSDFEACGPGEDFEVPFPDLREVRGIGFVREILERYPEISLSNPSLAGRYRVTATYRFDRENYKRICPKSCKGHDDPRAPWNLCFDRDLEARAEFVLRRGAERCACGRSAGRSHPCSP